MGGVRSVKRTDVFELISDRSTPRQERSLVKQTRARFLP